MKAKRLQQTGTTGPRALRDYASTVAALSDKAAAMGKATPRRHAKELPVELREQRWEGEGGALSRR